MVLEGAREFKVGSWTHQGSTVGLIVNRVDVGCWVFVSSVSVECRVLSWASGVGSGLEA